MTHKKVIVEFKTSEFEKRKIILEIEYISFERQQILRNYQQLHIFFSFKNVTDDHCLNWELLKLEINDTTIEYSRQVSNKEKKNDKSDIRK